MGFKLRMMIFTKKTFTIAKFYKYYIFLTFSDILQKYKLIVSPLVIILQVYDGSTLLTLFYTRGLGIVVSIVMVALPYRFSL